MYYQNFLWASFLLHLCGVRGFPEAVNALAVAAPPADGKHCVEITSCSACVTAVNNNCGWCRSTGTCSDGTHSGPGVGTCSGTWAWRVGECGTCGQISSCHTCTITGGIGNDGCGWCYQTLSSGGTSRCLDGNYAGPDGGLTCSGEWRWKPQDCLDCNSHTSCTTCTSSSQKACGWCASTETCSLGDKSSPKYGVCPGGQEEWAWLTCPAEDQHTCKNQISCYTCIGASEWSTHNCGWCGATSSCELGSSSGPSPYVPSCPADEWTFDAVCHTPSPAPLPPFPPGPSPDLCFVEYSTCSSCTSSTNPGSCGWCYNPFSRTGACHSGSDDGPSLGVCIGRWDWYETGQCSHDAAAPGCSQFTLCKDCTGDRTGGLCGWCGSTHTCMAGGKSGATHGTCSGVWYHLSGSNSQCISTQCQGYSTCTACTLSTSGQCGYCLPAGGLPGNCQQGNYSGSTGQDGTCDGGQWMWYSGKCPTPTPFALRGAEGEGEN